MASQAQTRADGADCQRLIGDGDEAPAGSKSPTAISKPPTPASHLIVRTPMRRSTRLSISAMA